MRPCGGIRFVLVDLFDAVVEILVGRAERAADTAVGLPAVDDRAHASCNAFSRSASSLITSLMLGCDEALRMTANSCLRFSAFCAAV